MADPRAIPALEFIVVNAECYFLDTVRNTAKVSRNRLRSQMNRVSLTEHPLS